MGATCLGSAFIGGELYFTADFITWHFLELSRLLLTLLQDIIYKVRSVMKGTMTYRNLGNFSMNWEVSLFIIPTPPTNSLIIN